MHNFIKAGLILLTIFSVGCATTPLEESQEASRKIADEDFSSITSLLKQAANAADPITRAKFQLQAAEAFRQNDDRAQAQTLLQTVDYPVLPQDMKEQYILIALSMSVQDANIEQTTLLLTNIPDHFFQQVPPDIQRQAGELKAQGYDLTKQYFFAAKERINNSAFFSGDEYWSNHERIWQSLSKAQTSELSQQQAGANNYELKGWLQLATGIKQNQISLEQQLSSLSEWLAQWPEHPAALKLPEELELLSTLPDRRPDSIALALPLTGPLAKAGEAIRDGFLATYYADKYHTTSNTEITLYDTNQRSFNEVYQEILSNAPDLIIGPLDKGSLMALEKIGALTTPVLALNYLNDDAIAPLQLYQFGLSAEDEARQLVNKIWSTGARQVITVMPETDWGQRIYDAFSKEWLSRNGEIVDSAFFTTDKLSSVVESLLAVDKSKQRARQVRNTVVESLEFTPRRRQDIDAIVLISKPETARQLKPLFSFHYASDIPIYSTSHIYSGTPSPQKDNDLNGIKFIETPWVLSQTNAIKHQVHKLMPRRAQYYDRLFALGSDAYTLAPRLILLERIEGSQVNGQTGLLTMNEKKQIIRTLDWARFVRGEARAER
ncbi:penicillin-binding protein activator [Alkalimarinus alittae]|uniref:Penicillin-binding protein activator n=1 Tax=Alkalimarinus alittae TaxID=2961619 RepID=A0ABY6N0E8_9ALTE|nr:penicillin-binding protein activator [Alkalimarinus alittae]UZE95570.1 penicillin-binding protein activator [Alkalimarinus alittae]